MNKNKNLIYALSFLLAASGFLLSLWPLALMGILFAAAFGRFFFAVSIGLLLDLAYGAPVGNAQYLFFPFTIAAFISTGAHLFGRRYFLERAPQEYM